MNKLTIKKCLNCGAIVKVITNCTCEDCGIMCCGKIMTELKPNSVDASIEKHKPTYMHENGKLKVSVNHVMEEDHFIEWICLKTPSSEKHVYFKPGELCETSFDDVNTGTIYSYCNKHGLWLTTIE